MGGSRHGFDFQNLHRNKQSMTLNLKSPEGHAIFMKLAEKADVIVENYRSDVKHRLKVDYETVAKINPRIVYGSIAGFGQTGPDAARPGVDQIAQGMGGLMSITGEPGRGPMRVGIPIADLTSGLLLAQGMILALYNRERTGKGQWVHTSLIEAQIFMLDFQASRWLMKGEVPKQAGNDHPTGDRRPASSRPATATSTSPPPATICGSAAPLRWARRSCSSIPSTPRASLRSKNRKGVNERMSEITKTKSSAHWIAAMNKAGVPCGPINSIDQTFAEPQVQHLGIARAIKHPKLGDIKVVGQPINLSDSPQPKELKPTPDLGQHTDEVLAGLGYDRKAIEALQGRRRDLMAHGRRAALVTGAGRNIGRACVLGLAEDGFNVAINGSSDRAACESVAKEAQKFGVETLVVMGDVGKPEDCKRIADDAIKHFGAVDVLLNNAALRPNKPFLEMSEAEWRRVISVDLDAAVWLSRACLPGMLEQGLGPHRQLHRHERHPRPCRPRAGIGRQARRVGPHQGAGHGVRPQEHHDQHHLARSDRARRRGEERLGAGPRPDRRPRAARPHGHAGRGRRRGAPAGVRGRRLHQRPDDPGERRRRTLTVTRRAAWADASAPRLRSPPRPSPAPSAARTRRSR